MKTLTGRVKLEKAGDNGDKSINADAKILIEILDIALMDAPSKQIAATELTGESSFPFEFSMTYDETPLLGQPPHFFTISIRIETHGKLDYITDTNFSLYDSDGNLLDHIDLFVIPIERD